MRVLVTGGAGFIGSSLVDRLLAEGHHVEAIDDLSTGTLANLADARREASGRLRFHQADILDPHLSELMSRQQPEVVFHLAGPTAKAGRTASRRAGGEVVGTLRVLEGCAAAGVRRIVCVAGARAQLDPVAGIAARAVQEYLGAYSEVHHLESSTVVLPTVYGPRQRTGTESSVVAVLVARAIAGETCVVHGDGLQSRDLLYVDDAVDALARCIDAEDGSVIEIGTGVQTRIVDLLARIGDAVASPMASVPGALRPGEPGRVEVDPARAAAIIGWRPFTDLDEGLAQVVAAVAAAVETP